MKKNFLLINFLIILLFGVGNVAAATFDNAMLFSDHDIYGWRLNSWTKFGTNPSSNPTVSILETTPHINETLSPNSGGYWGWVSNDPNVANGKRVEWSADNEIVSGIVPDDGIFAMPICENLQVTGGTGSNPIISWSLDFQWNYEFRIRVSDLGSFNGWLVDEKYYDPDLKELNHNFDFNDIVWEFEQGKDYSVRIEARKYINFKADTLFGMENVQGTSWAGVLNRSNAVMDYSNPVPEPATIFLFGLGLLGLAGVNRRKK